MPSQPFNSREEVAHYLAGDEIACLECGRLFVILGRHLLRQHAMSAARYRVKWGMPSGTPLAGQAYRQKRAKLLEELAESGRLERNPAHASDAAQLAGRGVRADWERQEQAARAAAIPHEMLPPGARRADGRDADQAREYQREWRARRKAQE